MPFKSEAQRRKFHVLENEGEISHKTVEHWEHATKDKKMLSYHKKHEKKGSADALEYFGVKEAGPVGSMIGRGAGMIGKGLNWAGRAASVVPGVGNAVGAVASGIGGGIQGLAQGEGLKGALVRGGIGAGTSLIPGGGGIAAGIAGDMAANKFLAPKPAAQPPTMQPNAAQTY